jgi:hypothetical protein
VSNDDDWGTRFRLANRRHGWDWCCPDAEGALLCSRCEAHAPLGSVGWAEVQDVAHGPLCPNVGKA